LNINCVDPLGRTALHVAIDNDNTELIELLLSYNVDDTDALLHAINEDNVEATVMLLDYKKEKDSKVHSVRTISSSVGCRTFFMGGGGLTLYIQFFQGAKMSLFRYRLAFVFMKPRSIGGANFRGWGAIAPTKPSPGTTTDNN